jgi:hypothetical protein
MPPFLDFHVYNLGPPGRPGCAGGHKNCDFMQLGEVTLKRIDLDQPAFPRQSVEWRGRQQNAGLSVSGIVFIEGAA